MRVPAFQRGIGAAAVVLLSMSPTVGMREYDVNRISSYSTRMVEAMQRVTITIDDDLVAEIDAFMAGRGSPNPSGASPAPSRPGLSQSNPRRPPARSSLAPPRSFYPPPPPPPPPPPTPPSPTP